MTTPHDIDPSKVHLFIATPTKDKRVSTGYILSLLSSQAHLKSLGARVTVQFDSGSGIILNRNAGLSSFVDDETYTHFMFIDDDMTWLPAAPYDLIQSGLDFVAGAYVARGTDWAMLYEHIKSGHIESAEDAARLSSPLLIRLDNWTKDKQPEVIANRYVEVAGVGAGFMLLTREAVTKLCAASRQYSRLNHEAGRYQRSFYIVENDFIPNADPAKPGTLVGEDYSLCDKWRRLGGKVYVDMQAPFEHTGPAIFTGMPLAEVFARGKGT